MLISCIWLRIHAIVKDTVTKMFCNNSLLPQAAGLSLCAIVTQHKHWSICSIPCDVNQAFINHNLLATSLLAGCYDQYTSTRSRGSVNCNGNNLTLRFFLSGTVKFYRWLRKCSPWLLISLTHTHVTIKLMTALTLSTSLLKITKHFIILGDVF